MPHCHSRGTSELPGLLRDMEPSSSVKLPQAKNQWLRHFHYCPLLSDKPTAGMEATSECGKRTLSRYFVFPFQSLSLGTNSVLQLWTHTVQPLGSVTKYKYPWRDNTQCHQEKNEKAGKSKGKSPVKDIWLSQDESWKLGVFLADSAPITKITIFLSAQAHQVLYAVH